MKTKNLVTVKTGSYLYGLANINSDVDLYTVYDFKHRIYRPRKQIQQHIEEETDHVKISLSEFEAHLAKGVPQACEVLFAEPEFWLDNDSSWEYTAARLDTVVHSNMPTVLDTYRRTIINFFKEDDYKKNRHGFRLIINARGLMEDMYFNPTLTEEQVRLVSDSAELPWKQRQELFKDQLWEVYGT